MSDADPRGPVEIEFVAGAERGFRYPPAIAAAGLGHRLAVVQHTHVAGCADMVFDEALWRALCDFLVRQTLGEVFVGPAPDDLGREEWSLAAFLRDWDATPADDRGPPGLLIVRSGADLRLCVVTEYWAQVGGPWPYADSYTYAVFSAQDLSIALPAFLRDRSGGQWLLSDEILTAGAKEKGPTRGP